MIKSLNKQTKRKIRNGRSKRKVKVVAVRQSIQKIPQQIMSPVAPPKSLLEGIGESIGGFFPGFKALGGQLGKGANMLLRGITGQGDYKVQANTIMLDTVPAFLNNNSTRICKKEYLGDIISAASALTFKSQVFNINPGNSNTFPWLSPIARNWQQYRFHGLVFMFKTMSADALNSVNTALGSIVMATQYNALEEAFTNKQTMENSVFSSSTKPSVSVLHPIECMRSKNVLSDLYIDDPDQDVAGGDPRLYDLGNFTIASVGVQGAGVNLGELWVSYDVELIKPAEQLTPASGPIDSFMSTDSTVGDYSASVPFGTTLQTNPSSSFGGTWAANTYAFPPSFKGGAVFQYWVNGTTVVRTGTPTVVNGALTTVNNGSNALINTSGGTAAVISVVVQCNPGCILTFNGPTSAATITSAQAEVFPLNASASL